MSSRIFAFVTLLSIMILTINAANDNSSETSLIDTVTGATKIEKELELIKEIPVKEMKIDKKEIVDTDKNFIEIFDDATSDLKYYDSTKRISSMIIFNDNQKSEIPSLNEEYEEDFENKENKWYKMESFIPENVDDFFKAAPEYNYKVNMIQPGKNEISESLGENIFFIAYKYFRSNNIKNAKILFEKLINYNRRVIDSYYYLSWCSYINKDYVTSIDYMNEAIIKAEKNNLPDIAISDYYYQIGNFYFKLEDYSNSIVYFFKALQRSPQNYKCFNKLGISYYLIGNPLKALEMWKQGMTGEDQDCTINYNWLYKKLNY